MADENMETVDTAEVNESNATENAPETETMPEGAPEKGEEVEFEPPASFRLPENVKPGEEFDVVCSFKVRDGKLCMTKLGDAEMPYGEEKGKGQKNRYGRNKPDYSEMSRGIMADMRGAMGGGGEEQD